MKINWSTFRVALNVACKTSVLCALIFGSLVACAAAIAGIGLLVIECGAPVKRDPAGVPLAHSVYLYGIVALVVYVAFCIFVQKAIEIFREEHATMRARLRRQARPIRQCAKCLEPLTGHEDEDGTHCRWCVTGWEPSGNDSGQSTASKHT